MSLIYNHEINKILLTDDCARILTQSLNYFDISFKNICINLATNLTKRSSILLKYILQSLKKNSNLFMIPYFEDFLVSKYKKVVFEFCLFAEDDLEAVNFQIKINSRHGIKTTMDLEEGVGSDDNIEKLDGDILKNLKILKNHLLSSKKASPPKMNKLIRYVKDLLQADSEIPLYSQNRELFDWNSYVSNFN